MHIVSVVALLWLSWPAWLSPWLAGDHAAVIASRLAAVHPLLAVNAIAPQFGYWIQSAHLYRLTSLGQDVMLELPTSIVACVLLHGTIGVIILASLLMWTARAKHPALQG